MQSFSPQIKIRKLDVFFELEEKIMSHSNRDKSLLQVKNGIILIVHFNFNFPASFAIIKIY